MNHRTSFDKNSIINLFGVKDGEKIVPIPLVNNPYIIFQSFLLLIASVISLSPPITLLTTLPANIIFITFCGLYLLLSHNNWRVSPIVLALAILVSVSISGVISGDLQYLKYSLYICLALFIIADIKHNSLVWVSTNLDRLIFIGLVLSITSFVLNAIWPIMPLIVVENPDGRENGLYYFTFTNFSLSSVIRPAFIFDEPGTFSFVVCIGAILRDILSKNKFITGLMLFLGMITFSLTHIIILVLFLVLSYNDRKIKYLSTVILILFSIVLFVVPGISDSLDFFVNRFSYDSEIGFAGDNRSGQIAYFFEILDIKLFFLGMPECFDGQNICSDLPDLGSNPFTPISSFGMIVAWPFYLMLLMLLLSTRKCEFRFATFALILLLLQRPFLFSFGYSLLILICAAPVLFGRHAFLYSHTFVDKTTVVRS